MPLSTAAHLVAKLTYLSHSGQHCHGPNLLRADMSTFPAANPTLANKFMVSPTKEVSSSVYF